MAKVDLITTTDLTAYDGSIVASGATVKFYCEFNVGTTRVVIRPKVYRSRELFENGFSDVGVLEIPREFSLLLNEDEFYSLTPVILYEKVMNYVNSTTGNNILELRIIET